MMGIGLGEALALGTREIISLVGGGGKTTLMFALAQELASQGRRVVTTTTTKILEPSPSQTEAIFVAADEEAILEAVVRAAASHHIVTLATSREPSGKLTGIGPEMVGRLGAIGAFSHVIVEADGAASRSIKAPRATEPVISQSTTLVVAVAGVDILGCPLDEEHVFRAPIAAQLLGLPLGSPLGAEAIATLILHPCGMAQGTPDTARLIPFLNKVDIEGGLVRGRAIAAAILDRGDGRLQRVVLGQALRRESVAEVLGTDL